MNLIQKRCWEEIDLNAVRDNFNFIKDAFQKPFYVVLKADAYGSGAKYLSKFYEELGAFGIAVACFTEAMEIRKSGVKLPILIMGHTDASLAGELFHNKLSQCVFSLEYARELDRCALYPIDCHLKLDTGMGRLGFDLVGDKASSFNEMRHLLELPNLRFTGIFSHFAVSDSLDEREIGYTQAQGELFSEAYKYLTRTGFNFSIVHGQNSAAILRKLDSEFNTMRAGIILYGLLPSKALQGTPLRPIACVKTVVVHTKIIHSGQYAGYGLTFQALCDTKLATIAIGYADGLPRQLKSVGHSVIINGKPYPVVAICMDQCMVDVTDGCVNSGDEVLVMGGIGETSYDTIAKKINTINYEIACSITRRVPRVYINNNKIIHIEAYV